MAQSPDASDSLLEDYEKRLQELQDDLEKSRAANTELRRQIADQKREIYGLQYEVQQLDEIRHSAEAERDTSRRAQERLRQQVQLLQQQFIRPETSPVLTADHRSTRHDHTFPETSHVASVPYWLRKSMVTKCEDEVLGERETLHPQRNKRPVNDEYGKEQSRDHYSPPGNTCAPSSASGQHVLVSHMARLVEIPLAFDTEDVLSKLHNSRRAHELSRKQPAAGRRTAGP
ncbi:hypothetical protein KCV07_g3777, partial [Aureobasidium melanogenum]